MSKTIKKYNRFSRVYDLLERPMEKYLFSSLRKRTLALAKGEVLEVGIGTGKNIPFYPDSIKVTGIDFSRGMLERAKRKIENLSLKNVTLQEMNVEKINFPDESFDTVVSTFVFCTVPDPIKGLHEVHRVLKQGGKTVFLEHMKSKSFFLNIPLYMMHVFTKMLVGTSMIRETQKNIEKAGFKIKDVENVYFDIVRLIVAGK
jgi:ubiquinone/menaquinone biosynthesis C-methylase UbiE